MGQHVVSWQSGFTFSFFAFLLSHVLVAEGVVGAGAGGEPCGQLGGLLGGVLGRCGAVGGGGAVLGHLIVGWRSVSLLAWNKNKGCSY